jgi:carboxyl-terminal processing protease
MWKAAKWGMASLAVALSIALAGLVGHTIGDGNSSPATINVGDNGGDAGDYAILQEIEDILHQDFVNPDAVDTQTLLNGAIDGEIKALGDAHTVYISPEDYALGVDIIAGTFQGIGASVDQDPVTGEIVIVAPFRDSPAEKAGIKPGDVILAVDGESTEGWSVPEAVKRIRGEQGTAVELSIRHSDGDTEDIKVERDTIVIPTVFTREVSDSAGNVIPDLAYIELQQFTEETVGDLREELKAINEKGYKGLILDLRRNPGGALDATVDVADMFLNDGLVLTQVDRDGTRHEYKAKSGGEAVNLPVAILVGPGSASGSEVLSGALRDHGRAKLIGEQTFGKGSVNHLRDLSNGGALYVTIARWITPNGEQIEGVGLAPDIPVSLSDDDIANQRDSQLFAAIDYLQTQFTQAQP